MEPRKVPVIVNGDHAKVVGWLVLFDAISDEEVITTDVSWGYLTEGKLLMEMCLVPKPRVVSKAILPPRE